MNIEKELVQKAKDLADKGEDFSVIVGQVGPEEKLFIKHHVLNLPEEIALKTIYGRSVWASRENVPRGRGRPRK